ncbi:brain and acute leukemia cytoplasmic protein isoform X3 [Vulpes vulpes]|uniref:Brain and acute leukemia cytoplasmic protein isoform X3 n=1 Tax=Vulpes vulpes TaxID=9627 RepID=A0ABM4YIU8_VULVU
MDGPAVCGRLGAPDPGGGNPAPRGRSPRGTPASVSFPGRRHGGGGGAGAGAGAEAEAEGEGMLEDGLSSNGIPRSAAPGGISNPEKKMSCGTQCPNPQSLTSGPLTQKQNGLRTMEALC